MTAVGAFLPSLTRKAFEKYGFSTAALLTDWSAIVGADLAVYTLPERLRWPKGVEAYGEVDDAARGRPGATLVLRVDGARVLDVQYQRAQIIDRINAYFGYRAVADMRFVQAPITPPRTASAAAREMRPRDVRPRDVVRAAPTGTTAARGGEPLDQALAAALARLGDNIARAR